jgi:hypothetical protein
MKEMEEVQVYREVIKINQVKNREFLRDLDRPQNDVEAEVNKNIKEQIKINRLNYLQEKMQNKKNKKDLLVIKKLPLIDKLKFDNMKNKSVAEKKRLWKGDKGKFKKKDLGKWFKLYDETKLFEAR